MFINVNKRLNDWLMPVEHIQSFKLFNNFIYRAIPTHKLALRTDGKSLEHGQENEIQNNLTQ